MVWSHLKPKKSLAVGGWVSGGRPNLMLAPGLGHRVKVTEKEPERAWESLREPERAWARAWPEPELDN